MNEDAFVGVTADAVVEINKDELKRTGGAGHVLVHADLLDSALKSPHQTLSGQLLVPGTLERICLTYEKLILNHPFYDGNKRTATGVLLGLLAFNGYEFVGDDDDLVQAAVGIANGQWTHREAMKWIRARVISDS